MMHHEQKAQIMKIEHRKLVASQSDIELAAQIMQANEGNKSRSIRELFATWQDRGRVARALNIRYQFVRNVLVTPVKKS